MTSVKMYLTYAFVKMSDLREALSAIKNKNGKKLDGKEVKVEKAGGGAAS